MGVVIFFFSHPKVSGRLHAVQCNLVVASAM